jgi:uncharacterized membrane protein YfcA
MQYVPLDQYDFNVRLAMGVGLVVGAWIGAWVAVKWRDMLHVLLLVMSFVTGLVAKILIRDSERLTKRMMDHAAKR